MTILLAPDKFKGSLTAEEVCDAIAQALTESGLNLNIIKHPLADGGEGSCDLLTQYSGGFFRNLVVRDPLFRFCESGYGISKDGSTAFLEMARASGLQLVNKAQRNPLLTTTYGTGQLMRDALDHGVKKIIMGVGGSATNDGGMGMAQALGLIFYDVNEQKLDPVGKNLKHVYQIDARNLHPRIAEVAVTIFCDVDNPLHGPHGAAHVFAPQKGATPQMVSELNEGLINYESVLQNTFQRIVNFPGAGAGGGLPASLQALTNLTIRPGAEFMIEFTALEKVINQADVVITGEGKMDEQTLSGKVVKGVADLARRNKKPVYVVVGRNELSVDQCQALGIQKPVTISGSGVTDEEALKNAFSLLKQRIREEIIPLLLSARAD
ncbi:MAG TPA: glycerate kinase [Ohtaekwangia sp.]